MCIRVHPWLIPRLLFFGEISQTLGEPISISHGWTRMHTDLECAAFEVAHVLVVDTTLMRFDSDAGFDTFHQLALPHDEYAVD